MKTKATPIVLFTLAFMSGILLGSEFGMPILAFGLGIPAAAVIFWMKSKSPFSWQSSAFTFACIFALIGIGAAMLIGASALTPNHISLQKGNTLTLTGLVSDGSQTKLNYKKAILKCEGAFDGKILLQGSSSLPDLPHNSVIEAKVEVRDLPQNNIGYANYLKSQGVLATAKVHSWCVSERQTGLGFQVAELRESLTAKLHENMVDPQMAGLATAMFIGDRSGLSEDLREDFSATGLSHILSISGMHVTIFYLFLNYLLGFLGRRVWGNYLRTAIILSILIAYMGLTGFSPAVCRAVFMLSVIKISETFFLQKNTLNVLALSAFVLLLIDPRMLFDLGFQLSYLAVIGLITVAPRIETLMQNRLPFIPKAISNSIAITLAAQLTTTPLVLFHFGQFPTYFILANLILLPIVSVATNVGIATLLFAWVPGLGLVLGGVLDTLLWIISKGSELCAELPGALTTKASFSDLGFCILMCMLIMIGAALAWPEIHSGFQRIKALKSSNFTLNPAMATAALVGFAFLALAIA